MDYTVETLSDDVIELGESPLWSTREQALYWVDVTQRQILRQVALEPSPERFDVRAIPAAVATRAKGGLIVAFRTGLSILSLEDGNEIPLETQIDFSNERFNDAKCDRNGRFFVGTMDKRMKAPIGALYRVDTDRSVHRVADGYILSNGIAWSPDDRILYHADTNPGVIYAYGYDIDQGTVYERRVHIDMRGKSLSPDGCTVDSDGCLWVAEWGTSAVSRYDPQGKKIGSVKFPVPHVTSAIFGGDDLGTLYVTSMTFGLSDEQLRQYPLSGRTFAVRPGVRGLPEPDFGG